MISAKIVNLFLYNSRILLSSYFNTNIGGWLSQGILFSYSILLAKKLVILVPVSL